MQPTYRRILLKLSGEALEGQQGHGLDSLTLDQVAQQLIDVTQLGVQVAVVLGGGNFFRGMPAAASGMDRSTADTIGMLATTMNCLAMQDVLLRKGQPCRIFSAIPLGPVAELFSRRHALSALEAGEVVLLANGTGHPFFTTDTAAALRALEVGAQLLLKATKVDGIYDKDPARHTDAIFYPSLTYADVLQRQLAVMDLTSVTLCRENKLPLVVFNLFQAGNIQKVVMGEKVGTWVSD